MGILYWLTVIGKHKQGIVQENCNSQIINEMELNYNSHFFIICLNILKVKVAYECLSKLAWQNFILHEEAKSYKYPVLVIVLYCIEKKISQCIYFFVIFEKNLIDLQ